jgi:hypothetical protein
MNWSANIFPNPAIEPPELEDYEWQYNGLTFGADHAIGVARVEGLDLATIRSGDVDWPRDQGQAAGLDLYGGRDIIFDLWMKSGGVSLQATQLELAAATLVQPEIELPLWFQLPNLPLLCIMCRPRKRTLTIDADYAAASIAKPELSFHATDPRIYTAGEETEFKPNHPATSIVLANTGNTESRPIVTFTGPLARPAIANLTIAGEPALTFSRGLAEGREELAVREQTERAAKLARESAAEVTRRSRIITEFSERSLAEASETAARIFAEETAAAAKEVAEEEEFEAKKAAEETHKTYTSERAKRETLENKVAIARERTEIATRKARVKAENEKPAVAEAAAKVFREELEVEEEESKVAKEKAETEAGEAREASEREGTHPTVKAGDQLVVNLSTPHLAQYYVGGIIAGNPESVLGWLTDASAWWTLLPENNTIRFSSYDEAETAGTALAEWASAYEV